MALNQCPECGKEVSSFAAACPHCGYPLLEEHPVQETAISAEASNEISEKVFERKKTNVKLLVGIAAVVVCIGAILWVLLGRAGAACEKAEAYLAQGDYEAAYAELIKVSGDEDAQLLLMNIYYETRFFEGLNEYVKYMKNPNSLIINDVSVHYQPDDSTSFMKIDKAAFVAMVSGQNGFGGYATGYTLLGHSLEKGCYVYHGSCNSLDISDYDLSDSDDLADWLACSLINTHLDNPALENAVNVRRIKALVEAGNYSHIAPIPELTFDIIETTARQ